MLPTAVTTPMGFAALNPSYRHSIVLRRMGRAQRNPSALTSRPTEFDPPPCAPTLYRHERHSVVLEHRAREFAAVARACVDADTIWPHRRRRAGRMAVHHDNAEVT